ncbi:hypothetical protein ACGFX4_07385 [Kitasatospora sp. NPDC048365]|uniref:hypothetical protein n=1 Tax=Kitasatospora sp. NPDC048365 TaxID=3364050 RepID=UPI00371CBADF
MDDMDPVDVETCGENAVVARFRLAPAGFGDPSQRATVRETGTLLAELIEQAGVGEFDGHEFGGGEAVLYAYGPDAAALFAVMAPVLRGLPFRPARVVLRHGPAGDPAAIEQHVDL